MPTIQRKLFLTRTSPYARKVIVCAAVQNVELEYVEAPPFEDAEEVLREAPVGRVPALFTPEGTFHDSRAICRYLGMNPETSADLELVSLADALMDGAVAAVLEARRPTMGLGGGDDAWIGRQMRRIERVLDALEALAPNPASPWSLGSIGLAVALAYLDFRHASLDWRKRKRLAAFAAAHFEREEMRNTAFPV